MQLPKITIIIPSFSQGEYIEKTITSLLDQNYPALELLIFDGGSTDNTINVIKKYEDRISYWVSEPDKGQSDAINKGLRMATGEVCNWLCSDDYLEPGSLEAIGTAFLDNKVNVVSGNIRVFDNDKIDYQKEGTVISKELNETIATSVNVQPATFFRLNHFKQSGLLTEDLHFFMDKELWIKYLFEHGQDGFKYLDQLIAHYLVHPQSKTFQEMDPDMYDPTSRFKIDNNTIFKSLAKQAGMEKAVNVIEKLTESTLDGYNFNFISTPDLDQVKVVVNYYLYHEAKKNFYKNNYKRCREIVSVTDLDELTKDYQKDLKYYRRRSFLKSII